MKCLLNIFIELHVKMIKSPYNLFTFGCEAGFSTISTASLGIEYGESQAFFNLLEVVQVLR